MLIIYDDAGTVRTAGIVVEPHVGETEAACIARMIAAIVPPGARTLLSPPAVLSVNTPPERWVVDWNAGTITGPAPPPEPVPDIGADQARLWLLSIGKTDADIVALINTLPPEQSAPALILWEYRTVYKRSSPLWDQLGPGLGLTPSQMDAAFRAAALL